MMKKIYTSLILVSLILVFSLDVFSSEAPPVENFQHSFDGRLYASFNISGGLSRNIHKFYDNSSMKPGASLAFSVGLLYFLSDNIGISVDLVTQSYNFREEVNTGSDYSKLSLKYIVIGIAPVFQFHRFYMSTGIYFGILTSSSYEGSLSISEDVKFYTRPDIGLKLTLGYIFELSEKFQLLVGIEVKTQLNNFIVFANIPGKVFSAMITIGLLFDLQIPQKTRREIEDENLSRYNR